MTALSYGVAPWRVAALRDQARLALDLAAAVSLVETADGWLDACERGDAQLWHAPGLWAVTRVVAGKAGWVAQIVAMAGVYDGELVDQMEAWARSTGCTRIYFAGRPGWLKRRPDYRLRQVTLEKEL